MCHVAFNLLHRLDDHSTMNFPMLESDGESTSIVQHLCSHLIVDYQKQEIFVPEFIFVHRNCYNNLLLTTNGRQDVEEYGIDTEGEREANNEDKEGDKTTDSTVDNDESECSDGGDDGSKYFDEIQTMLRSLIASSTTTETTTTITTCEMTQGLLEKLRIGLDGSYNVKVSSI